LKIVQKLISFLDNPEFINTHKQRPQDFTRHRTLDFKTICLFLLKQPQAALAPELNHFFQQIKQSPLPCAVVSPQAFSKARRKLKPAAFNALNEQLQHFIDQSGLRQNWCGLRLLAVDGSTLHLPLESELSAFFGTHQNLPGGRASTLYDVTDGQVLHSLLVPLSMGERACAASHLEAAPDNSLILFDRGYPCHWLCALHQQKALNFVMRLKLNHT